MKFNIKHFEFSFKPWRINRDGWKTYYEVVNKKKAGKRTTFEDEWLKRVRSQLKASECEVTVTHTISGLQTKTTIKTASINRKILAEKLISKIRAVRENSRRMEARRKDFGDLPYQTYGGVFGIKESILSLSKHPYFNNAMSVKRPRSKSLNYIGVELEFNENGIRLDEIASKLQEQGLGRYTCVGRDGSCGVEVRVLLQEENWFEPLSEILKVITGLGFTVDHRCGTHVHLDMRNRDIKRVYKNFFFTQSFLRRFLTKDRKKNTYCKLNTKPEFTADERDRFQGINVQAYHKYQTLEIRMHQGTLKIDELGPWIKMLLRVANYGGEINKKVLTLKQARQQYELDPELSKELAGRLDTMYGKTAIKRTLGELLVNNITW